MWDDTPRSGQELMARDAARLAAFESADPEAFPAPEILWFTWDRPTITLGRMQEKGYLESRQEPLLEGAISLPRRLYRPTGHALNILAAWRAAEQAFAGLAARPQET